MKMIRLPSQLYGFTMFQKILGHVLLNWSKMASKFLQITNHHIHVKVLSLLLLSLSLLLS